MRFICTEMSRFRTIRYYVYVNKTTIYNLQCLQLTGWQSIVVLAFHSLDLFFIIPYAHKWFSGALWFRSLIRWLSVAIALGNRHQLSLENREIVPFSSTFLLCIFLSLSLSVFLSFWSFVTFLSGCVFFLSTCSLLTLLPLPACLICCFSSNAHETRLIKYVISISLRAFRFSVFGFYVMFYRAPFRVLFFFNFVFLSLTLCHSL